MTIDKIECKDIQGIKTHIDIWINYVPIPELVIDTFDGNSYTQISLNKKQAISLHHRLTSLLQLEALNG